MSHEDIVKAIQTNILPSAAKPQAPAAAPAEPSSFMRRVGDVGLSTAQGVVGLGEAALGIADIPTMGHAGRGAEIAEKAIFGGTTKDAQAYLESLKSPEAKLAQEKVAAAKGFLPTAGALLENPSALVGTVAESLPSMVGGAGLARAGMKALPTLAEKAGEKAALYAGAAGEGAISAGSTAESIRQQDKSGLISPEQAAISGVSGVLTGGLGIFGGKMAARFGVSDVDTLMAGGVKDLAKNAEKQSILKAAAKGALAESVFEELPQSMQEQISMNVATGKPWDENVAEAGATGAMAALVMGGGGAGASQALTNANIKAQAKKDQLAATQEESKAGKSLFEEQDDEDAGESPFAPSAVDLAAMEEEKKAKEKYLSKTLTAQERDAKREAEHPFGDTMLDEKTGFPLFSRREDESHKKDYVALVNTIGKEAYSPDRDSPFFGDTNYAGTVMDVFHSREFNDADTTNPEVAERLYNNLALSLDANGYSKYLQQIDPYTPPTRQEAPSMPAAEDVQQEFKLASQKVNDAIANKDEAAYEKALEELKIAREKAQTIQPGFQAPLFAQQQGLDFNQEMPVAPEGQAAVKPPTIGQQGLDFTQEQQGEYTPPKVEAPKFGFTTDTSAAPLQQFLSRFKPRSTSEAEREKQQAALFGKQEADGSRMGGLLDQIAELYVDDSSAEQLAYSKGVIDSFFDKYAATDRPSKQAALDNINNLSAEDQTRVLNDYTRLPDLTTYEGVKKLSDAFQDHVAEAELAGLGITKSSSAYKQADEAVRSLRKKPRSQYDEQEQAAYNYFSNYGLDLALRSAAFDISVNTPRNQLYRGQGKDSALQFQEWLNNNALESAKKFDKYLRAYKKQYEGYKAFQEIQKTKESEAETVADYVAAEDTKNGRALLSPADKERSQMMLAPLHPVAKMHILNNNLNGVLTTIASTSPSPYQRRLAARLAELNLYTAIGIDNIETILEDYTPQSRNLLSMLLDAVYPNENVYDIMRGWDNAKSNLGRFHYANVIVKNLEGVEIPGAAKDIIKDLKQQIANALDSEDSRGAYYPNSNSIMLRSDPKRYGVTPYTILHEVMHAATARIVNNPTLYSSTQQAAVYELKQLYALAKKEAKGTNYYGVTNVHEFIAEAFTNSKFQDFLKGIKYKQSNMSLWDKFVQYCLEMFGYDNVLSSTMANVNTLFGAPDEGKSFVIAAPLYAKRNKGMFESNSAERSKPTEILNDLIRNNTKWEDIKDKMSQALSTMNTQTRKHWLGAFTLRQMDELIGTVYGRNPETGEMEFMSKIPQISKFLRAVEDMTSERAKVIHESTQIAKELMNLQRESKATVDKLTQIVQTSTVQEVDPTKPAPQPKDPANPTKEEQDRLDYHKLVKEEWDKLGNMKGGKTAQDMYVKMREFFKTRLAEFKKIAYEREFDRLLADAALDASATDYADQVDALQATARSNIDNKFSESIEPYFPLKRFGEFWVRYGTGKNRKYMQFEDAAAKNKFLAKARADYANTLRRKGYTTEQIVKEVKNPAMINHGNQQADLVNDLFSDRAVYEEVKDIVSTIGGTTVTDPEELRKLVLEQLGELYITTLPLQSVQRMFLHRQNVAGASNDLIRSFQHAGFHMAYQHARFKHAPRMDDQLAAAKSMVDSLDDADEKAVLNDYLAEINRKYRDNVIKPPPSSWLANKLSNINFLWYLTAPASAIVNMMAVPSIALPVLGGKFGTKKSWSAITKYMTMLSGSGWKDFSEAEYKRILSEQGKEAADKYKNDAPFDAPSIGRSSKLTPLQKRAYEAFSENLLEQSLAHDAAALSENPSLDYTGRWGKIMQIATFPFHKAERFNREITAMAAFDLAYEKNGGNFEAAVKEASDLTWKTMFDYATYNKPRYMQGNLAKVLLAFKQYAQHMTYLLMRTAYEATADVSKAEFDELASLYGEEAATKYAQDANELRAQARKTFALMMGMSFVFAGAAGLPIWWMYSGMAKAFNAVFGNDELPFDVDNDFKNMMNNTFGGFVGDSISRGVIPQLTGVSLADRMSTNLPDMWFRDTRKNNDEVEMVNQTILNLLGPTVGLLVNGAEAVKRYNDGNTERAFEAIAPGAFKNLLAGSRLASEGALTMKGDTLIEDISGPEAFKQMLGFTPERLAQRQAANIEAKSSEQAVMQRRQDLLNFLAMAIEREDEDGEAKVLAKIEDFNDANDWAAIKASTIRSSIKKRAKARAMSDELGGLNVNKNFRDIAEEQTGYAADEEE
jgi:hypothetical protein